MNVALIMQANWGADIGRGNREMKTLPDSGFGTGHLFHDTGQIIFHLNTKAPEVLMPL